ncbi:MAG: 30S ribosomal protein S17 [Verrucomicrobia bacterium]|nr:MAG: 30S ribosomal protein S17 [Verrucomicrobiota bacterium]
MPDTQNKRPHRKERTGVVVSDKMQKTIVVRVERKVRHPRYKKVVRRFKKFYAHDEREQAKVGDWVRIQECRPISRLKCWRLVEVLSGPGAATAAAEPAQEA